MREWKSLEIATFLLIAKSLSLKTAIVSTSPRSVKMVGLCSISGGPKGFLKIIDDTTLGFADFRGNRQYISAGNIISTKKTSLFLIDYPTKQRLKIWAESEVHHASEEPELVKRVEMPDYNAQIERIFIMKIRAFDWNCPQHITPLYTTDEIAKEISLLNPAVVESCYAEQE